MVSNPFYTDFRSKNTDRTAKKDGFGNVSGNEFDLAKDNAFKGKVIAILHLYTGIGHNENFDFLLPEKALQEKGFSVVRWQNALPDIEEFKKVLSKSTQLWIISTETQLLNASYLNVIKDFFNQGHGLFLWGDNDPFHKDADFVSQSLFNTTMSGYEMGDQVVSLQKGNSKIGIVPNHPITTGLEFLYEGITIAAISINNDLKPLMYSSAGNVVTAYYERDEKRAILDGGFTRLYCKWDTAGTARFVKNAAAWLANTERFELKTNLTQQNKIENNSLDVNNIISKFDNKNISSIIPQSLPNTDSTINKF
ncbi:MAG: hypothetical protein IPO21_11415 [Bacteroidales bacterium]|nr:hypothetical protein [Bacteroidales bacterium]